MDITIDTPAEMKAVNGQPVTDTAGNPIAQPIALADLVKPVADPKPKISKEAVLALMADAGFQFSDINSVADDLIARMEEQERKQKRNVQKMRLEEDTKKLRAVQEKLIAAITPIIEEAGIKMDIPGKQIVYHVGDAGSPCWDIAYPEPLADKASKSNGNGHSKERKAVFMGEVHLRIPELSVNEKIANSLSQFYSYFTGKAYNGFKDATVAVQNIGDGSEGKGGQDGVFKVKNVPAIPETATTAGSKPYNIVTLSEKGYSFFNITKGKAVQVTTAAPTAAISVPVAEADKPADWNIMSKADKKAWRHQNQGRSS
jgi:hypothetical protein